MISSENLAKLFQDTRTRSEKICSYLETEDYVVQPIVDVSPPKWHLGHTSWFFEEFVLKNFPDFQPFDEQFAYVFNSYYESVGEKVVRTDRGNLSRPTVMEVYNYRKHITEAVNSIMKTRELSAEIKNVIETGCHHEQQHQELLLTDIKYILGNNPILPKYNDEFEENPVENFPQKWIGMEEGIYEIGHKNPDEFCYDNELGLHKTYLENFEISNKLVTNGEFLEFMEDDGYKKVLLWHSEAWEWIPENNIGSPLYWHNIKGKWWQYTLNGIKELNLEAPLSHISYFEAFAFAQWKKMRLPTEFEWEVAQKHFNWGLRWEWTESAYSPYPNFKTAEGALGEYNGKFMVNQKVLRGGSVATTPNHSRPTYRNFFQPSLRWQFTGLRLAR
ncbi:MAG TPA: ergothioneine biosynthesis protein EgtB [Salinimicrobium sp.]|nr:ergothioneine biosynthesis protein EgtB [Salinimicrobium sp.]